MIKVFSVKYWGAGLLSLILIEAIVIWWQYNQAIVVVVNQSGQEVSKVHVAVKGGTHEVGQLSAGGSQSLRVHPSGESDVSLTFDTSEHKPVTWTGGYIESHGGYRLTLTIGADWQITAHGRLSRGFILLPLLSKVTKHNRGK